LLVAAQRQIAERAKATAEAAVNAAAKITADAEAYAAQVCNSADAYAAEVRTSAEVYAAGVHTSAEADAAKVRTSAEFERAGARAEAEREAGKLRAAVERERDGIIRAARREADEIRRREQFLLEQSEALRTQAEADLEVELAARREAADREEVARLEDAQDASRRLVEEAERRAADAEKRAADAVAHADQTRRDAEADAKKGIDDAHRKAELIIARAKDDAKQALVDIEADGAKRRAAIQKELDDLTRQKNEVDATLAEMRKLFSVPTALDDPPNVA
jgi:hypothetical protein